MNYQGLLIFGRPWRDVWIEELKPTRQTRRHMLTMAILIFGGGSLPMALAPLTSLAVIGYAFWAGFGPTRLTPEEQRDADALTERDRDALMKEILAAMRRGQ